MEDYDFTSLQKILTQKMPFGRYRGTTLIDLPERYLVWFHDQGFPEGEIGKLLLELYEIKRNGLEPLLKSVKKDLVKREMI